MAIQLNKPVKRVVRAPTSRNAWAEYVATFAPEGVYMREKGKRTMYGPVGYGAIFLKGAQRAALDLLAEKKARKASRRLAR